MSPEYRVAEIDDNDSVPFIILTVATPSHSETAVRLTNSAKKLGLPYISIEIPSIHRSVSPRGINDPDYSKPSLISTVMAELERPILYLDADMIVAARPFLIEYLAAEEFDFGIFNWLSLQSNQAYKSTGSSNAGPTVYTFSHGVDATSRTQLICSGCVHYWGCSEYSIELLAAWRDCVTRNPECVDDHSLDYAFNNLPSADKLKTFWLPRAYARYAWWVFDTPVLNHPDYPNPGLGFVPFPDSRGRQRIHMEQLSPRLLTSREATLRDHRFVVGPDGSPQWV
jgi:hypothetical protein